MNTSKYVIVNYGDYDCMIFRNPIEKSSKYIEFNGKVFGFVYLITNLITDKVYVGQTTKDIFSRFKEPRCYSKYLKTYLAKTIQKYGSDNFDIEALCYCISAEELNDKEKFYIKKYRSNNSKYGYNLTEGGESLNSKNNPMYGTSAYKIWLENFGLEEANKRLKQWKKRTSSASILMHKRLKESGHKRPLVTQETRNKLSKSLKNMNSGKNNGMYRKQPYDIWVEKFGRREANKRQKLMLERRLITRKLSSASLKVRSNN